MTSAKVVHAVQTTALIVSVVVVFVGGIVIHAFVVVGNVIDWTRGRPLSSTDQIITSLEISRTIFMLFCLLELALRLFIKKILAISVLLEFVRVTSNYSCVWFLTLLSVVFCLKISNFHSVFFRYLKSIIATRVAHLIVASVLVSASHNSLNVWITFEFADNDTANFMLDVTHPRVYLFLLWNIMPLLIYVLAAVPLIAYLSLHIRRMKSEVKITHLDSYHRAMRFTAISFFSCAMHIFININPTHYSTFVDIVWVYVILNILPIFHSVFLIFVVKKHKNRLFWILQQGTKCCFFIRRSETSF
ncbi:taste receptor type 2 member 4-like [Mantella aurantiaca]